MLYLGGKSNIAGHSVCLFPRAAVTKYYEHGLPKTIDIYCLAVLEARNPK